MGSKKLSKSEAKKEIEEFFEKVKTKKPKEIKKIKKLGMRYNLPLKDKRKLFCKKCFFPYKEKEKIRIKRGIKSIVCEKCGSVARWKMK
jgi:RNase P subunit RPR2